MAVIDYRLGWSSEDALVIVAHSDATTNVTLNINGGDVVEAADTSVNGGWVRFDVTGLDPDTEYPFTINAVAGDFPAYTLPENDVRVAVWSCLEPNTDNMAMYSMMEDAPHLVVCLGDAPYAHTAQTRWGVPTVGVDNSMADSKDVAQYIAQFEQVHRMPAYRKLNRKFHTVYIGDDHEWPFDNPAPTDLAGYQAAVDPLATQPDLDDAWAAAKAAQLIYTIGNPVNGDAPGDTDPLYTRWTTGDTEYFLLSCIEYRSPVDGVDDASKTMLGANQKAWLIASIIASTAKRKCILTPKQFWEGGPNTDTWLGFQTELLEVFDAIKEVTGVYAIAGDQHLPNDQYADTGELFTGSPAMRCLVACPLGQPLNVSQGDDPADLDYILWKRGTQSAEVDPSLSRVWALITSTAVSDFIELRDVFGDGGTQTLRSFTIVEDSNVPVEFSAVLSAGKRFSMRSFLGRR